jgi:hypothetical protein
MLSFAKEASFEYVNFRDTLARHFIGREEISREGWEHIFDQELSLSLGKRRNSTSIQEAFDQSITGCNIALVGFLKWRGSPRYWHEKWATEMLADVRNERSWPSHRIGTHSIFAKLVCNPEASAKILMMAFSSLKLGLINTAASSAYRLILKVSQILERLCSRPTCCAFATSLWRGSMANKKSIGERRSLCHTPL